MRLVAKAFVLFLAMGPVVGCANLGSDDGTGGTGSPVLTVGCTNNIVPTTVFISDWELQVSADSIEAGKPFTADLSGVAVIDEDILDRAQALVRGGVREIDLVDLNATVHVRSGALGTDEILEPKAISYQCFRDRSACDHANDLPSVPGRVGNTDCEGESPLNPCGRFVEVPTTTECNPGGTCAARGKTGPLSQCETNDFCVIGDLRIPLEKKPNEYTANVRGEVLFGWDDENTDATIKEDEPNKGTWVLPPAVYEVDTGPNGVRFTAPGVEVAFECTMGVNCADPVLGVGCSGFLSSRTPDEALISLEIETEVP